MDGYPLQKIDRMSLSSVVGPKVGPNKQVKLHGDFALNWSGAEAYFSKNNKNYKFTVPILIRPHQFLWCIIKINSYINNAAISMHEKAIVYVVWDSKPHPECSDLYWATVLIINLLGNERNVFPIPKAWLCRETYHALMRLPRDLDPSTRAARKRLSPPPASLRTGSDGSCVECAMGTQNTASGTRPQPTGLHTPTTTDILKYTFSNDFRFYKNKRHPRILKSSKFPGYGLFCNSICYAMKMEYIWNEINYRYLNLDNFSIFLLWE